MKYELTMFSLLFFTAVFIYMYWGTYIIRLNSKASTNRLFLLICISIGVWSLGFAMANSAVNQGTALFWHRFASIGWTTSYGFVLHFLLLLSIDKNNLKEKQFYWLLHIPGIISMYVFGLSSKMAPIQYNLEKINYGWINKLTNNGWDLFFNIYYVSYMLVAILIIWKWQARLENKTIAKRGQFIIGALLISSIIGTFTDRIASSSLENPLPQMGPLFILLPTWAMYHSARYYGVMKKENIYKKDIIVTEEDKKNIFDKLSWAFYVAAILAFLAEYIPYIGKEDALKIALLKALSLVAIGVAIRLIQRIKNQHLKENLTIVFLVSSIPITLLQYLKYGSLTSWAFPMIIIISSVIFSKKILLTLTTVIAIGTQTVTWILRPEVPVVIDKYDYILRISMFVLAFLVGRFINKIYVEKIKENKEQIEIQKMNLELSLDVSKMNQENFDRKMNTILSKIGKFFGVDKTYLCLIDNESSNLTCSHRWINDKSDRKNTFGKDNDLSISPWMMDQLKSENLLCVKDNGKIQGFIGIDSTVEFENWSEQKKEFLNIVSHLISGGINKIESEKEINFMAYYDDLTKLPNWRLFGKKVKKAIETAKEKGKIIGIIFIDLDNFKVVNDTMGHNSGDQLLKKVANSLKNIVGENGLVSRSGGDEFLVLLKNMEDEKHVLDLTDRVMSLFTRSFNINKRDFVITASGGVAIYPLDGTDSETLVKNADLAMYEAKEMGKKQYALCTSEMKEKIQMNTKLSNDMYEALDRDEFALHYQPQIDLATGEINGVEALIRWNHPEKGMISPGIFIPLAEKNGMMNSIGQWVLRTACLQGKKWLDMGFNDLSMGVNLSGVQFLDPNIVDNVENILEETGLDPKYLELEITESIAIKKEAYAEEVLNKLKEIGVKIAIDDFGTEYSSLGRLRSLPLDRIKIDMQFTQSIEKSEKDRAIIMVIINLAKKLGMSVIAEGAETKEQVEFLQEESCDDVQGYYYYRPMPEDEVEEILEIIYYEKSKVSI